MIGGGRADAPPFRAGASKQWSVCGGSPFLGQLSRDGQAREGCELSPASSADPGAGSERECYAQPLLSSLPRLQCPSGSWLFAVRAEALRNAGETVGQE
ncbi:unnamed protein product [Rangifer tarandus platyrhynchus]|uniref:Uncharacterized protein n=1 Tax=Rangifer tarandus platyrhynchus TaxID=3082113 RepID=A0AC59Z5H3_RANTA